MKLFLLSLSTVFATVYFKETFDDDKWSERWIQSQSKDNYGKFIVSPGKFYGDRVGSRGLQTSEDAKFYAIAAQFDSVFDNTDVDLVVQFSAKFEQEIDCGGGYLKILPPGNDLKGLNGDSKYNIMFGPDICGSDKKTHVIFNYKDKNHLIKKMISPKSDTLTHLYTLIVKPDQTYSVLIDNEEVEKGDLISDWDMLPPKEIDDPKAKKPKDWVDEPRIQDPTDVKPEGYDDIPPTILDSNAVKPEDWDDDMDGEWEAPKIANPEYKGAWKPKMIDNPDYKGPWKAPKIPNPDYKEDKKIYKYKSGGIFIDLWQVKSGTIFDDIIVTDSIDEAKAFAKETFFKKKDAEEKAKKVIDDEEAKKRAAEEEERKKNEPSKEPLDEKEMTLDDPIPEKDEDDHDEHEHDHDHDEL